MDPAKTPGALKDGAVWCVPREKKYVSTDLAGWIAFLPNHCQEDVMRSKPFTMCMVMCLMAAIGAIAIPTGTGLADDTAIQIESAVVCQDVVDREPVGSGDVFAKETPRVYCFCKVVGAAADTQITHNWYYKGSLKASVKLNVRSSSWRTWSSKTIIPEWDGEWMVEILSEDGSPLESIIFYIQ